MLYNEYLQPFGLWQTSKATAIRIPGRCKIRDAIALGGTLSSNGLDLNQDGTVDKADIEVLLERIEPVLITTGEIAE
jgi:hypothetical protein